MNFLAHQHLSFLNPDLSIGNFVADFLRGKEIKKLTPGIQIGVQLHRKIDSFTDQHQAVKESLLILKEKQGRYSPVVLDVYYDYFLANNWNLFSDKSLNAYSAGVITLFNEHIHLFPEQTLKAHHSLTTHNWLANYKHKEGIERSFYHIKKRLSFKNSLDTVMDDLEELSPELEPLFLTFYPELLKMAKNFYEDEYLQLIK